ncbi:MAG: phosphotransferase family protein, partial [Actinomycetota bacterium]
IRAVALRPELRSFALENLERIPEGERLCHGDFHPGNTIVTKDGLSVIDWPGATRGHPGADHARTLFLLKAGEPLNLPPHIRALVLVGRGLFASIYAGAYRHLMPVDSSLVQHARIAHIAARLAEGIAVEEPRLIAMLEKALARA